MANPYASMTPVQVRGKQKDTSGDLFGSSWAHPVEAFESLGRATRAGAYQAVQKVGGELTPEAQMWLDQNNQDPEARHNAEVMQKQGIPMVAGALAMPLAGAVAGPALAAGGVEGTALAGGTMALEGVAGSVASHGVQGEQATVPDMAKDALINVGLGGVGAAVGRGLGWVGRKARDVFSPVTAESAARQVNPEYTAGIASGDIPQAGIRNETGDVVMNPNQVLNPKTAGNLTRAQQREQARLGEESTYTQNAAEQNSNQPLRRTVEQMDETGGKSVQDVMQDIHNHQTEAHGALYRDVEERTKAALAAKPDEPINFEKTQNFIKGQLEEHANSSEMLFEPATVSALKKVSKGQPKSWEQFDAMKRSLSKQAGAMDRAGNYDDARVLRKTRDQMISDLSDHAGTGTPGELSLKDADLNYATFKGDTGKKTAFAKIVGAPSENAAAKALVRGENAVANTEKVFKVLDNSVKKGTMTAEEAQNFKTQLAQAMGHDSRRMAVEHADANANGQMTASTTTLGNDVRRGRMAVAKADELAGTAESAKNDQIQNVIDTMRTGKKQLGKNWTERMTSGLSSMGGATVGGAIAGAPGAYVGGQAGGGAAEWLTNSGFIDKMLRRGARGKALIEFASNPDNARAMQQVVQQGYKKGLTEASFDQAMRAAQIVSNGMFNGSHPNNPFAHMTPSQSDNIDMSRVSRQPVEQHAQTARTNRPSFDSKTTAIYHALAHAETGHLKGDKRWIRTQADESAGPSSAYGPVQITRNKMRDFLSRHSDRLTPTERRYAEAFIRQGDKMLHADKNDPVYGHGKAGILTGANAKARYADIARKMLDESLQRHRGDVNAVIHEWRGNNRDTAYFRKVNDALRSLS